MTSDNVATIHTWVLRQPYPSTGWAARAAPGYDRMFFWGKSGLPTRLEAECEAFNMALALCHRLTHCWEGIP